jgi:transposase
MHNPLLVGVDVHRRQNVICLMDAQGQELGPPVRVANNRPGTQNLVQQLGQVMESQPFDGIRVSAEATGWYWFHFFQMLNQHPALAPWPLELYASNPRLIAKYKESLGEADKTDPIDAVVAADWLRTRRTLPTPFAPDAQHLPLRLLTRYRYHVVHNLAREKSYCLAVLYLKASEYTHPDKQPFADVFSATSRALLQQFTSLESVAAIPFDELVELIDAKGKRRFPDPTQNARKLQQVAQDSYPLSDDLLSPVHLILTLSLQQIVQLERQERRLSTAIAQQMASIPHTLDTIPGFGPVYSAGIIAEIGDIARFDYCQAKLAKYAGLQWRRHQSADFQADHTPLTRSGNRYLRYYLCEAANAVRMHDVEYAAFYHKKFHEVRKHRHKRAIVLTARKLVRLVARLLTTREPYRLRRMPAA